MSWNGESHRHATSRKGIKTTVAKGRPSIYDLAKSGSIHSRQDMEKYLWHTWNDITPHATPEEVKRYKDYIASRTDEQIEEIYERQRIINQPLSEYEERMQDLSLRDLFR